MRMDDFQPSTVDFASEAPGDPEIDPRTPVELDDRNTFVLHAFAKWAHAVQAEHDGFDPTAEAVNRFGDQHLGSRNVHDVQHEPDSERLRRHWSA